MTHIKIINNIAAEGLEILTNKGYSLEGSEDPNAILLRSSKLHDMTFNESLVAIARAGAGVNNIPVDKASEHGVVVFNTPGSNANAVSELVLASMVVAVRNMIPAEKWSHNLTGDDIPAQVEKGKKQFKGTELRGKTLGVIGLGSVGHLVANAGIDLGMRVIGYDPYIKTEPAYRLDDQIERNDDIDYLYEQADFVTIHVPSTPDNYQFINGDALKKMKNTAVLLNFSRGDLIDNDALVDALDKDELSIYATDFPNEIFIGREDCLLFPHLGASTIEAEKNSAVMAASQLVNYIETGNVKNAVNFPNVEMDMETSTRLSIVNRNIPNMINILVDEIGKRNINIVHFMNKSRGDYAYTLIDIEEDEQDVLEELKENISKNENILSIRLIQKN